VRAEDEPPCAPCLARRCTHAQGPVCMEGIRPEAVERALGGAASRAPRIVRTMRMAHYYAGMAFVTAPCLVLTLLTGAFRDASDRHLVLGFTTAILCVATNTLLILFMIVSGRVLRAAIRSRDLAPQFLA